NPVGYRCCHLDRQSCFARRAAQRLDPPVIQIAAAIENHLLDALLFGAIGNGLADELCAGQIPAADFRVFRFGAFTPSAALFGVGLGALFGVALGALFS